MDQPNTLVVYYSDTGNTRLAAEQAASLLDAVLEPIQPRGLKAGLWGYLLRAWAAFRGRPAGIEDSRNDPRAFDLVVVCSPVWMGHISTPARAYLMRHVRNLRQIALVLTSSAGVKVKVARDLTDICGRQPVAVARITDADRKNGQDRDKITEFVALAKAAVLDGSVEASGGAKKSLIGG